MTEKIKVIYIAGMGHSGSTLLDLILGSHSNAVSVGEMKAKALTRLFTGVSNKPCTCGASVSDCSFWTAIRAKLADCGIVSGEKIDEGDPEANRALVESVLQVSGKRIYVESTKSPGRLERLLKCPDFDVHVIGLHRDPRAVGFSEIRKKRSFYKGIVIWQTIYSRIERVMKERSDRFLPVYYEDFVVAPEKKIVEIMQFAGENFEPSQMRYLEHEHHNLMGNGMRFSGSSEIRPSVSYLDGLRTLQWFVGSWIGRLALRRHGYAYSKHAMRKRILGRNTTATQQRRAA